MSAVRACVDLRRLTPLIKNEDYPLPRIEERIKQHHGKRYFASLDLADGYHQWLVEDGDRCKISFLWGGTQYQFCRACFGVKTMTSLFQRVMTEILIGIPNVDVYVDDIMISAVTVEEFIEIGRRVLQKLNEYNLRLRVS